ncbi:MAG: hypothetical protein N4A33_11380 [Bacteriovoracaceae bacterium]|jgi:lipoprotein-releasing system permease protein|nr:hypothetical protein [Bacteriovoracaceae bacterium]
MFFFKYFCSYIFKAKTRQRLLAIAVFGLFISSFSLVVLQGIMGGLQNGVIGKSKEVLGSGKIKLSSDFDYEQALEIQDLFKQNNLKYVTSLTLEVLVKSSNKFSAAVVNGIDTSGFVPDYLKEKDLSSLVLGYYVSKNVGAFLDDKVFLISPAHTDYLVAELPRQVQVSLTDVIITDAQQVDNTYGWIDIKYLQNLIRKRSINTFMFFNDDDYEKAVSLTKNIEGLRSSSWEDENRSLVWALKLETTVMIILFVAMSLLVSLCITSGFMIFFDKVKIDLLSFYILGKSKTQINRLLLIFTQIISAGFTLSGVIGGILFLNFIDSRELSFIPDFFAARSLPVSLDSTKIIISFVIPYLISCLFSYFSYRTFKSENTGYLNLIRSVG